MDNLIAIPHDVGLQLLRDELYEQITKFCLVDEDGNAYYESNIHSSYFDELGILTCICIIPKEDHFTAWNKYINIKSKDGVLVVQVETPAIQFVSGIGGEQVVKISVTGEPGEIVYKADEYITITEAQDLLLGLENKVESVRSQVVGSVFPFIGDTLPAGVRGVRAIGSDLSRVDYADLFAVLGTKYGAGDGSTTFGTPDLRGLGVMGDGTYPVGAIQGDAIRNITGETRLGTEGGDSIVVGVVETPFGVFKRGSTPARVFTPAASVQRNVNSLSFDASLVVPTAEENRPKNIRVSWYIIF